MAPHSSTLAWKIPWTEEPGRLQSMGSRRVGHDWVTSLSLFTFMHWRRKWQPTPVFLPGESQGWGCTESDTTEVTQQLLYNDVLVSALHWISPVYTVSPFGFPSHWGHCWVTFPLLYSHFSLLTCFICRISTAYMSVPISQFIPRLTPLVFYTFVLYICVFISASRFTSNFICHIPKPETTHVSFSRLTG